MAEPPFPVGAVHPTVSSPLPSVVMSTPVGGAGLSGEVLKVAVTTPEAKVLSSDARTS